ncbi:MAG: hypothetical protein GXP37_13340 [Chloroflexi bacterium]|nr:hypothetical protein [Chloroflexota bacterium]
MFANRLARWVSVFFDSSVLSLFVFPAIGWHVAGFVGVGWSLVALLMLTGFPLTYLAIGRKRGWVSDWELTQRAERPRFILVSLGSDVLALAVLGWGGAPATVWALALVYASLGITMFIISNFWKISLHMVTVSGFSVLLSTVFGAGITWVWLSLPLVAWARLHRKKHNGAQLVVGALLGALITAAVLKLAGIG